MIGDKTGAPMMVVAADLSDRAGIAKAFHCIAEELRNCNASLAAPGLGRHDATGPDEERCRVEGKPAGKQRIRVPTHEDAPRTFQRMLSGRRLHLLDPSSIDLEISDLLIGISRVNRWCGQTIGEVGFNVAHHCCVVERVLVEMVWPAAPLGARRWALAHDLPEAVYGDVVTPVKAVLGQAYKELEHRLEAALCLALGFGTRVPDDWRRLVKRADMIAAVSEAVRLAGWAEPEARKLVGGGYRGKLWDGPLEPWGEREARETWLERFRAAGGRA